MSGTIKNIYTCGVQHYGSFGDCEGFGTGVVISGDDGRTYSYAHMKAGSVPQSLKVGSYVQKGRVIGAVGTTGYSSGAHLHFGISNSKNYWESGPNPSNEAYIYLNSDQVITDVSVQTVVNCEFLVTISANTKVTL